MSEDHVPEMLFGQLDLSFLKRTLPLVPPPRHKRKREQLHVAFDESELEAAAFLIKAQKLNWDQKFTVRMIPDWFLQQSDRQHAIFDLYKTALVAGQEHILEYLTKNYSLSFTKQQWRLLVHLALLTNKTVDMVDKHLFNEKQMEATIFIDEQLSVIDCYGEPKQCEHQFRALVPWIIFYQVDWEQLVQYCNEESLFRVLKAAQKWRDEIASQKELSKDCDAILNYLVLEDAYEALVSLAQNSSTFIDNLIRIYTVKYVDPKALTNHELLPLPMVLLCQLGVRGFPVNKMDLPQALLDNIREVVDIFKI